MIEITGPNCLVEWLKREPPEFACGLVARIALRVAPILKDALHTDDASRRVRIILPSFRAVAALNFAGSWPHRFEDMWQASRTAARRAGEAMAMAFNESQINLIDAIEAVPEEHFYIHEMESDRDGVSVASHAFDTIVHAARAATDMVDVGKGIASVDAIMESVVEACNAAHSAVDGANGYEELRSLSESNCEEEIRTPPHITVFWKAVERDVVHLEENSEEGERPTPVAESLSRSPLWAEGIPTWASRRWSALKGNMDRLVRRPSCRATRQPCAGNSKGDHCR